MFLLLQLLLVLSAYILLLALDSTQFLISSANSCLCWAPILLFILLLCLLVAFYIQSIYLYTHLLYVDHCWFCSLDGNWEQRRVSEREENKKKIMWSVTIIFWMVYCILHWRRSRTPSREAMKVVCWKIRIAELLFLISLSVKIINLRAQAYKEVHYSATPYKYQSLQLRIRLKWSINIISPSCYNLINF